MTQWTTQNKNRPGAYVNFESTGLTMTGVESSDVVAVVIEKADWGVPGSFHLVDATTDTKKLFGRGVDELIPIKEALKATSKVLAFNGNNDAGSAATATDGTVTATAKHKGLAGNQIHVIIKSTVGGDHEVKTVFFGKTVDKVVTKALPYENDYVKITGTFDSDKTIQLTGGTSGATTNTEVENFLNALDTQDFKVLALGTDVTSLKVLATAKVTKWRSEGRSVVAVLPTYTDANSEGVVSVANGVTLSDGTKLTAKDSVYFVAGAYAGAKTDSNTYKLYPQAVDCERKTNEEVIELLGKGETVFTYKKGRVLIEQDINTLTTFTAEKNKDFSKNKLIRIMDAINENVHHVFTEYFIGKVRNNADGRELFKQQIITLILDPLASKGELAYKADELDVQIGQDKDVVTVTLPVTLTDAMEKLYMTVTCR